MDKTNCKGILYTSEESYRQIHSLSKEDISKCVSEFLELGFENIRIGKDSRGFYVDSNKSEPTNN